jgi:DNA-binding MarR family transcriptional regulator
VAQLVHASALRLLRLLRQEDAATGVGPARLSALSVLVFGGPRTLGELAAVEGVRAPTMSRIVGALVDGGLVRRRRPPGDRRTVMVAATAAGRKLMLAGRDRRVARLVQLLKETSTSQLATLAEASSLLAGVLERRSLRR